MNIFEQASRLRLRFSINGEISTEQLWTASMQSLINFEQALTEVVESYGKSTRRLKTARTQEQAMNELRLAIVTHILDVREAEAEVATTAAADKAHNQRILELIKNKQDEKLASMSVEELEKLLK
jgi:hypothetical protein